MPSAMRSQTIPKDRLLPGIHGLRGIAAIAVVLFHLAHIAKISTPGIFLFIQTDFGYGVHLFFILCAFSLMHSTKLIEVPGIKFGHKLIKRYNDAKKGED